ncbi:MAG: DUF4397 domain-containing protein [Gemmatimonadota bacterium]
MRITRLGLLGALVFGVTGCQEKEFGPFTTEIPPLAFVRYINALPDTNNTTVRWVDQLEFTPMSFLNVPFRGLAQGNYQGLEAGSRRFKVFTYDPNLASSGNGLGATTAQLADTAFAFQAGKYYTILHMGCYRSPLPAGCQAARVLIIDDNVPAANTSVQVRVIHAAPGAGNVDIYATAAANTSLVGATPVASGVGVTNGSTVGISAYLQRATGAFALQIAATGTTTSLAGTAAPAGTAGTTTVNPIFGATVAGSTMTAIAFPATVAGSRAAAFAAPGIVFYGDRSVPRTAP